MSGEPVGVWTPEAHDACAWKPPCNDPGVGGPNPRTLWARGAGVNVDGWLQKLLRAVNVVFRDVLVSLGGALLAARMLLMSFRGSWPASEVYVEYGRRQQLMED